MVVATGFALILFTGFTDATGLDAGLDTAFALTGSLAGALVSLFFAVVAGLALGAEGTFAALVDAFFVTTEAFFAVTTFRSSGFWAGFALDHHDLLDQEVITSSGFGRRSDPAGGFPVVCPCFAALGVHVLGGLGNLHLRTTSRRLSPFE